MSSETDPTMLIDAVDAEPRNRLTRLHQKLKVLQAEISSKLDFINDNTPENQAKKVQLMLLSDEIDKALQSITMVIRTEIARDVSTEQFLERNQDELDRFREMVKQNSDQLGKMTELFDANISSIK